MIQQVKAAVQKFRDLPEDSTVKTKIRSGKAWAIERCQKFRSLPTAQQLKIIGFTYLGVLALSLLTQAIPDPAPTDRQIANTPSQPVSQGNRRSLMTKEGYIGAWSQDDLDLVIGAVVRKDVEAVASLMAADRAFWIPENRAVEIRGRDGVAGSSRVEAKLIGSNRYFWTVSEAIH
jgi:hypothetical protein